MKARFLLSTLLVFLFSTSCNQDSLTEVTGEEVLDEESCISLLESRIITRNIYSESLKDNLLGDPAVREVSIYLPKGYSSHPSNKLPVVYYLPGQPAGAEGLFNAEPFEVLKMIAGLQQGADFPEEGFKLWLDDLMENGSLSKFILVIPDATNKYGFSMYSNSEVNGNYEEYIARDLVRYIDRNFNTIRNHKGRAVVGHCMGGYGALKIAMKYPQIFGQVAGMSPAHFPDPTVEYCANIMLLEDQLWGFQGPLVPFDVSAPYKFVNNTIYGISAAWLGNPDNPPYYLDLPFSYSPEGAPILNEELMSTWRSKNLLGLIPQYIDNLLEIDHLYFDCGMYDELGMTQPNMIMHDVLLELGVNHDFELFEGYHISNVYERLEKNLIKLSEGFPQTSAEGKTHLAGLR